MVSTGCAVSPIESHHVTSVLLCEIPDIIQYMRSFSERLRCRLAVVALSEPRSFPELVNSAAFLNNVWRSFCLGLSRFEIRDVGVSLKHNSKTATPEAIPHLDADCSVLSSPHRQRATESDTISSKTVES